jgi:glycosyltransferase involved in cell wall biosynthesis
MVDSEETWRGGEAQVELLMRGLLDRGVHIALAAPATSVVARRAEGMGVTVLPLSISGGMDLGAVMRLRRYLRREPYDLVHCHSSHAHGVAWLALGPGRRDGRGPRLIVSRRVDFSISRRGPSALKYRSGVDRFLAVSTGVRKVLLDGGVRGNRIDVVPDGIDLAKFGAIGDVRAVEEEFGLTDDAAVIGNVAALAPHKSQEDFVRAARIIKEEIPRARFFIVGEGELRTALESLVQRLGLERDLIMTGFRKDVLAILSTFDCFVLSSYLEGLCTSIMDAQAMGIPVVATRTGGVPDLVADGETGLLVPPRDPDELADGVIRMLADDRLRSRCVERAREQAQGYDYSRMVEGTLESYRRVLARGGFAARAERRSSGHQY